MAIVLAGLLGLCVLAFVLHPIYSQMIATRAARMLPQVASEVVALDSGSDAGVQPSDREQAARSALQEVELDFQLGNISQGDYNQLRERYMRRALLALKQRYEREQELDAAIEEQVRLMRTQEEQGSGEQEEYGENT